jgi:hypothetical protein
MADEVGRGQAAVEVATKDNHGRGIQSSVRTQDTRPASLDDLGLGTAVASPSDAIPAMPVPKPLSKQTKVLLPKAGRRVYAKLRCLAYVLFSSGEDPAERSAIS